MISRAARTGTDGDGTAAHARQLLRNYGLTVYLACRGRCGWRQPPKRAEGKVIALFFPILLFVLCGYEHCIANLYYLPAGAFAAAEYGDGNNADARRLS